MSALLLDTHAFVWAVGMRQRLSGAARRQIEDRGNELFVSSATAWELATKFRLGKLAAAETLVHQYTSVLDGLGAQELPIESAHALRAGGLQWAHRDPFDRMLAAQALIENLTLVSRDPAFGDLPGLVVAW